MTQIPSSLDVVALPHISVEYIRATHTPGSPAPVEAALELPTVDDDDVVWSAADWDPDDPTQLRWLYLGDKPIGAYVLWSRVIDAPQEPVREHGLVHLT